MSGSPEPSTVLVVRVWLDKGDSLRGRVTRFDDDGLPHSVPVSGSPRSIADVVERLIDDGLGACP